MKLLTISKHTRHSYLWSNTETAIFSDSSARVWEPAGVTALGDILTQGHMCSFAELQDRFKLSHTTFFKYLQIRDYVAK